MRFSLFLDTSGQQGAQPPKAKGQYRDLIARLAATTVTLATLWVVVGSAIYPLYWFEFILKRGFLHWRLSAYGLNYLIQNIAWLLWGPAVAAIIVFSVVRKWLPGVANFFSRRSFPIIAACFVALLGDAFVLYKTQHFKYTVYSGLGKIAGSIIQLPEALVDMGLPPSKIVPPVDVIYADTPRISMLYSELQPELIESERTRTAEKKSDRSIGLEGKPMALKSEGSRDQTETQKLTHPDPSTSQRCLSLINTLLFRKTPPYYSTFDQLSYFQFFVQAKQLLASTHENIPSDSIFVDPAPGMSAATAMIKHMFEARQKMPLSEIEHGVREQLSAITGLVIIQGDFKRTSHLGNLGQFEEQFRKAPRQILFRFPLRDKDALRLLTDRASLLVLGDIIKKWDGGLYIDLQPIAIISGSRAQ